MSFKTGEGDLAKNNGQATHNMVPSPVYMQPTNLEPPQLCPFETENAAYKGQVEMTCSEHLSYTSCHGSLALWHESTNFNCEGGIRTGTGTAPNQALSPLLYLDAGKYMLVYAILTTSFDGCAMPVLINGKYRRVRIQHCKRPKL